MVRENQRRSNSSLTTSLFCSLMIIELLKQTGAIKFGDFTLASGKPSKYYIDVKLAATKPAALEQICAEIVGRFNRRKMLGFVCRGCNEPVETCTMLQILCHSDKGHQVTWLKEGNDLRINCKTCENPEEYIDRPDYIACVELGGVPIGTLVSNRTNLPLIIVRKAPKDHGVTKSRLVGDFEEGKTALLIEDVTTTGGSSLSAVQALRGAGLQVDTVITVVDRQEGSQEALADAGITLIALTTAKEILIERDV